MKKKKNSIKLLIASVMVALVAIAAIWGMGFVYNRVSEPRSDSLLFVANGIGYVIQPFHFLCQNAFTSDTSLKHGLPVSVIWRESKQTVQPDIVQYQAILLALKHTHATSYLLQILRQRQCGSRQLDKLYIGTVKAFTEQIDIHQHLNVECFTEWLSKA